MKQKLGFTQILIKSARAFMDDKALKMSASLAYYTIFSIAPLLIIIISLSGLIYGQDALEGKVFAALNDFLGGDIALQIQEMIKRVSLGGNSGPAFIIGLVVLIIGATGVFTEIQDSINEIWRVKANPQKGWIKLIINRLLSFSLIIGLGFLLVVSLIVNGLVMALSNRLSVYFPDITVYLVSAINMAITFVVIATLFAIIYKFLPDVKLRWKQVRIAAAFTTLLFMIGHFLFGLYVSYGKPGYAFGAAGSLVLLLLWIYYTAVILYFGAEFTRVYSESRGEKIELAEFAVPKFKKSKPH
ncbi:MAG: YihY/virulence factor BrkB family protein [Sphingobacteriaceae bacterium]